MAQTKIKYRQIEGGLNGWIPAEETWTYASADDPTFTFTVAADVTTKYSAGMKIKLTQGTVKYFIITAVSTYSGGNTTITVYGGTDYDLASAAISNNYYSTQKAPQGFPMSPSKWSVITTDITIREQVSPTQNTYYNLGSLGITVPIGSWKLGYMGNYQISDSTLFAAVDYGLGTTTSSFLTTHYHSFRTTVYTAHQWDSFLEYPYEVTSKTVLYYNIRTTTATVDALYFRNDSKPLRIWATCAYL